MMVTQYTSYVVKNDKVGTVDLPVTLYKYKSWSHVYVK